LASGVWTFPWYASNLKVWLWLSLGFFLMGSLFFFQLTLTGFLGGP
jgi:hypothetical protein